MRSGVSQSPAQIGFRDADVAAVDQAPGEAVIADDHGGRGAGFDASEIAACRPSGSVTSSVPRRSRAASPNASRAGFGKSCSVSSTVEGLTVRISVIALRPW